jgi:hypothetical protein
MLKGLWWCPGLLWHGHPGPCVPTARKRLSALTALVGAMRMAAIVIDTDQKRDRERRIKGLERTCFDMHHRVMAVGSAGIAGVCFLAGLTDSVYRLYLCEPFTCLFAEL